MEEFNETDKAIAKGIKDYLPTVREDFRFRFAHSDQFVVWIIGSDVVGIALLVGNADKLKIQPSWIIPAILGLLYLSILCGIIYKLMSVRLFGRWTNFEVDLMGYPETKTAVDEEARQLTPFNYFLMDKMGMTEKRFKKSLKKKKMYPSAIIANNFFTATIYLFLLSFTVLVFKFIF